ncbi:uncharacterized protein BDW47DRAFT_101280, partial [Aspergillus candidus]
GKTLCTSHKDAVERKEKKQYSDVNISGISLHIHPPHKPTKRKEKTQNKRKRESGKRAPKWPNAQAQGNS